MITIKKMEEKDTQDVYEMMRDFYDSPAILHEVPGEVHPSLYNFLIISK